MTIETKGRAVKNNRYLIIILAVLVVVGVAIGMVSYTTVGHAESNEVLNNNVTVINSENPKTEADILARSVGGQVEGAEPQDLLELYNEFSGVNGDTVAYLRVRDTTMNFPVVQQHHNCAKHNKLDNCYYLYRDVYKREAVNTSAISFMDCSNAVAQEIEDFDQNTVIYGHTWTNSEKHNKAPRIGDPSDKQLGQLVSYTSKDWLEAHKVLEMTTGTKVTYWVPQYVAYTDCVRTNNPDGFNYNKRTLDSDDLAKIKARSVVVEETAVNPDTDKLITLSTCNYRYGTDGNNRFIVVFREIGAKGYDEALELANDLTYTTQKNQVDW